MAVVQVASKSRLLRRMPRARGVFLGCALLIPILLLITISYGIQRTFLVEADTSVVRVTFDGANAWRFDQAVLCTPREIPDRTARTVPDAPCSAFDQMQSDVSGLTIPWPDGTRVIVRAEAASDETRLRITLPDGMGDEFAPRTEIVVPEDIWTAQGALLFSGEAVLGNVLGSGERFYLHAASWEARQTSTITRWLRTATDKVLTGRAIRGAELSIGKRVRDNWFSPRNSLPAAVYGHLTPPQVEEEGLPYFSVTFVSEPGLTELRINYFGLDQTRTIRPDIIDTTASSVLLLAAIALLSFAAAVTQIVSDLLFTGRDAENGSGTDATEGGEVEASANETDSAPGSAEEEVGKGTETGVDEGSGPDAIAETGPEATAPENAAADETPPSSARSKDRPA